MTGASRGVLVVVAVLAMVALVQVCEVASPEPQSRPTITSQPTSANLASRHPGPAPTTSPSPSRSRPSEPRQSLTIDRVVSAGGVRQWVRCLGSGPVTLVVVAGLGTPAQAWHGVLPAFVRATRTCIYDRPGIGRSPSRPDRGRVVDVGLYAAELKALLDAIHERGPYVLLGHSFGGLVGRAFVHRYGGSVAGLLLAESVTPGDPTVGTYWNEAGHRIAMTRNLAETGNGRGLGTLPLLVLSASNPQEDHLGGRTYGQPQWMVDLWVREQAQSKALSSDAVQVVAVSGHVLEQDNPAATEEAVRELVRAAEVGTRLRCSSVWPAVRASCR